jgi:hypothetical protein
MGSTAAATGGHQDAARDTPAASRPYAVEAGRPWSLLTLVRLHEQRGVPHYSHEVWLSVLACVRLRARVRSLRAWRRRSGAEASQRCKPRAAVCV